MKSQEYISPDLMIVDLEPGGVLCASDEYPTSRYMDSLQDYDPSEGAW